MYNMQRKCIELQERCILIIPLASSLKLRNSQLEWLGLRLLPAWVQIDDVFAVCNLGQQMQHGAVRSHVTASARLLSSVVLLLSGFHQNN